MDVYINDVNTHDVELIWNHCDVQRYLTNESKAQQIQHSNDDHDDFEVELKEEDEPEANLRIKQWRLFLGWQWEATTGVISNFMRLNLCWARHLFGYFSNNSCLLAKDQSADQKNLQGDCKMLVTVDK